MFKHSREEYLSFLSEKTIGKIEKACGEDFGVENIPTYIRRQIDGNFKSMEKEKKERFEQLRGEAIREVRYIDKGKEDEDENSEDYPVGGLIEPYDIARELEME